MLKRLLILASAIALPVASAHAVDIADGKTLYDKNCASCHGVDGTVSDYGKKLEPFPARNLRAIAAYVPYDEVRRIVTHGTHKTKMRAMKYTLDPLEIEAIVDYVKSFTYSPNLANGEKRFKEVCASCHGNDGRAKTGVGAKNLVYSNLSMEEKIHTIRYGRPGTLMEAKRHQLSNTDIADIAAHVHSLTHNGDSKVGGKLYGSNCASCHANPKEIKLIGNAATKKTIADTSDYMLDLRIRHGRHVHRAGDHITELTDDEVRDIISYLRQQTK